MNVSASIQILRELITALDRRRPQAQRLGEAAIAQDAAELRSRALERIDELEREPTASAQPLA
jgi:hypothetical protein